MNKIKTQLYKRDKWKMRIHFFMRGRSVRNGDGEDKAMTTVTVKVAERGAAALCR